MRQSRRDQDWHWETGGTIPGQDQSFHARQYIMFTTMAVLYGTGKLTNIQFVIIAQSSATVVPLAGCDPCEGSPARAWKQP